jgi:hypothetical protein
MLRRSRMYAAHRTSRLLITVAYRPLLKCLLVTATTNDAFQTVIFVPREGIRAGGDGEMQRQGHTAQEMMIASRIRRRLPRGPFPRSRRFSRAAESRTTNSMIN